MHKVVLVDDDPITISGMKNFIKWQEYNFAIVGEALDGISAVALCREIQPDLAIVDMKMPGLSGIELIKMVKEDLPETEFIILSGYGEFELARQALRLQVFDYLLKPIQRKHFQEIITKISQKFKDRDTHVETDDHADKKIIKDIKIFIKNNIKKDISLQDVALKFSLNQYYVSHLFKKETGVNFLEFLTTVKMERAKELLDQSELRINEIAGMVGYNDSRYFSQVFRKNTGFTPREYREKRG